MPLSEEYKADQRVRNREIAHIVLGDTFTMDVTPRLPLWGRLMVRLRLRRPPKPVRRTYTVTAMSR